MLAAVLLVAAAAAVAAASPPRRVAPLFKIDMSEAPETRWREVIARYRSAAPVINAYFEGLVSKFPRAVVTLLSKLAGDVAQWHTLSPDARRELRALADGIGIDFGRAVVLNVLYELREFGPKNNVTGDGAGEPPSFGACSSLVGLDADGVMSHHRNLDWQLPDAVRNLTFRCDFYAHAGDAAPVYAGACFPGYVGVLSGSRLHQYAVTINERMEGGNPIVDALEGIFLGRWAPTHLVRHVLASAATFDDAVAAFREVHLAAPVYLILSGAQKGEGLFIERARTSVHAERKVGDVNADGLSSTNYVFKTNYDVDVAPPAADDRRAYGVRYLRALGANATRADFARVVQRWPIWNFHTSYYVEAVPSEGIFDVLIRLKGDAPPRPPSPPPPAA
eukprot:CAMPEP_0198330354 /NCGR_PEP_ID=MMETSP1450-20131203/16857_1 /TAXON_ID=753684 ORGANISM="Madagascaria erythrocladiodes, Strain CCMP3234" /NCGR_SAMPLE_ID=MMETSP1450 /ASSEMBLY_ACC=CAM_ASM_001115 /LENGTH=391 /DNA_ID=CAMNT_0044034643 /DNA_START=49 /DNA_END=1221 /DNA_ORIENTATION=-